jgi:hypothetical protein
MNPRIMARSPDISITISKMMSSSVIGIEGSCAPQVFAVRAPPGRRPVRGIRACHSGLRTEAGMSTLSV